MPFPFVAVTLPDDTPPAYIAGLLSACSQAYPEGSCRTGAAAPPNTGATGDSAPEKTGGSPKDQTPTKSGGPVSQPQSVESADDLPVIVANVAWSGDTTATVLLGLPHWRDHRWIERSVPFKEHDQPIERYRALGFTIGSLAVTVSEVAKLEQEARETQPQTELPAPTTESAPAPKAAPPETIAIVPAAEPPDAVDNPPVIIDTSPTRLFVRGYFAGELGEGFDPIRRGGTAGIGLFGRRWGAHVSGYYSDASGRGLHATFAGVEVTADVRVRWSAIEANFRVGGGYGHVNARVQKEGSQAFPSAVVAVNLIPARWQVAPYLGLGVRIFRGVDTDVPGLEPLGPITPFVQLGFVLSSQSAEDAQQ